VLLLNDLEAAAWGVDELEQEQMEVLQRGAPVAGGNRAVIAAGSGLGQAGATWHRDRYRPFACEGGHCSFSPTRPLHLELLEAVQRELEHVSWERIVSGPGLVRIHRFLLNRAGEEEPGWLVDGAGDPAAAVAEAATSGDCEIAGEAVDLFAHLFGSVAGNLALVLMATGGLFVVGGIAPKLLDQRRSGHFMEGFLGKGRMRRVLETVPVSVVLETEVAVWGAARAAVADPCSAEDR
jgi:glucokinase